MYLLKPLQNKKVQKKFPGAQFSVSFSQLPAVQQRVSKEGSVNEHYGFENYRLKVYEKIKLTIKTVLYLPNNKLKPDSQKD